MDCTVHAQQMHSNRQQMVRIGMRRTPRKVTGYHFKWLFQGTTPILVDLGKHGHMPLFKDLEGCRINGKAAGTGNSSITGRGGHQAGRMGTGGGSLESSKP
jgi:hypothetical protein